MYGVSDGSLMSVLWYPKSLWPTSSMRNNKTCGRWIVAFSRAGSTELSCSLASDDGACARAYVRRAPHTTAAHAPEMSIAPTHALRVIATSGLRAAGSSSVDPYDERASDAAFAIARAASRV